MCWIKNEENSDQLLFCFFKICDNLCFLFKSFTDGTENEHKATCNTDDKGLKLASSIILIKSNNTVAQSSVHLKLQYAHKTRKSAQTATQTKVKQLENIHVKLLFQHCESPWQQSGVLHISVPPQKHCNPGGTRK